jgi:hypothetical protein
MAAGHAVVMAAAEIFTLVGLAAITLLGVARWWEEH